MHTYSGKPSAVISAEELSKTLNQAIIFDCRPFDDYEFCHINGALHIDIESMLSTAASPDHDPAKGGRNPLPKTEDWEKLLRGWGIQPDSYVVAYDDAFGAEGAAKAWWMLTASGINAAVLDGGWETAVKARLPINEDVPAPMPSTIQFTQWLLPTMDMEAVDKLRYDPDWILLDTRAPERWSGELEQIDPVPGRIQGSKNLFFKENLDGSFFKKPEDLRKMYLELLGPIPPERLIVSCGSGMTASHSLLALYQAGLEGAYLYPGSYSDWCRNKIKNDI
jgi:thiosulfate/3-mercaptopyruvate sulfurtransferase